MQSSLWRIVLFLSIAGCMVSSVIAQESVRLRNSFGKSITVWRMPNCTGDWVEPGTSFLHDQTKQIDFLYAGKHCLQILDRDGARLFVSGVNFARHVAKYELQNKEVPPIDLKIKYRTERRSRQVAVQKTRTQTRTLTSPVTRMRIEQRTRQVAVTGSNGETKYVTQNYTVSVPYAEAVTRSIQVQVPYTEMVTQNYTVRKPVATLEVVDENGVSRDVTRSLQDN